MFTSKYGYRAFHRALHAEIFGVLSEVFFCIVFPKRQNQLQTSLLNP